MCVAASPWIYSKYIEVPHMWGAGGEGGGLGVQSLGEPTWKESWDKGVEFYTLRQQMFKLVENSRFFGSTQLSSEISKVFNQNKHLQPQPEDAIPLKPAKRANLLAAGTSDPLCPSVSVTLYQKMTPTTNTTGSVTNGS
jgi:hypothetical protein